MERFWGGWGVLLVLASVAAAEDFRIATRVFVGEEPTPVNETVTLFTGDKVYDFLSSPARIAIFRQPQGTAGGRFILLDPERKVRTELTTDELTKFATGLKAWAVAQEDPLLQFCGRPSFAESWQESTRELSLTSPPIRYHLRTEPLESREASLQYREFCDWYARLGAMLHPGTTPPFPRLEVNSVLSKYQVLPRQVQVTITAHKPYLDRIDEANAYLVQFRQVDLTQYRNAAPAAE